jgi:plastocyanin
VSVWTDANRTLFVNLNSTTGAPVKSPASVATSTLDFSRNANVAANSTGQALVVWEDSNAEPGATGSAKFKIRAALLRPGGGGGGGTAGVSIGDNFYNPSSITVSVGTEITWTNNGTHDHTVTEGLPGEPEGSGLFDSEGLSPGQKFKFNFTQKGTFTYWCEIHGSSMTGTVIVQ